MVVRSRLYIVVIAISELVSIFLILKSSILYSEGIILGSETNSSKSLPKN
jgi:hypothetical protein